MNGAMLRHLLDGLEAAGAPLERVVLYQGREGLRRPSRSGAVAVLRGREPAPYRPNFYFFTQEDELRARAAAPPAAVRISRSCDRTWWWGMRRPTP